MPAVLPVTRASLPSIFRSMPPNSRGRRAPTRGKAADFALSGAGLKRRRDQNGVHIRVRAWRTLAARDPISLGLRSRPATSRGLFDVGPKHRVDPRLIAGPLIAKESQNVRINPEVRVFFALWHGQFG